MARYEAAIQKAREFAADKYANRPRRGRSAKACLEQAARVAELIAETTQHDPDLAIAGFLHRIFMDTHVAADEIGRAFGPRVLLLVAMLTERSKLPMSERQYLELADYPMIKEDAKVVKLAGKLLEMEAFLKNLPTDWPTRKKVDYIKRARRWVGRLGFANMEMENRFNLAAAMAEEKIVAQIRYPNLPFPY